MSSRPPAGDVGPSPHGQSAPVPGAGDGPRQPGRPRQGAGWDASNKAVTFYCPVDLVAAIEAEVAKGRRSKTQVIVQALRAELGVPGA